MFFKKKDKKEKGIPTDEVRKMTKKGMSDKDIIKKLKSQGYSYDEIESAMLQAVKSGVTEEQPTMRDMEPEMPELDSFYSPPQSQRQRQRQLPEPDFEPLPELESDLPQDIEDPSVMLEELVEGVIDEKWHKFEDNMRRLEDDINKVRAEMGQFEQRVDLSKKDSPSKDLEIRLDEMTEKFEDLESRVAGLEKAFRQFLPSLTKNIESLSKMIHELKSKQEFSSFEEPAKF